MLALPWGGDFRWQNASYYFQNMTLLIEHVNARPDEYGLRVLYATPSEYFTALNSRTRNRRWPMVQGDVFTPYDNNMKTRALQGFETGIYDSQTEEKRWTRRTMNTLRAADLSHALAHACLLPTYWCFRLLLPPYQIAVRAAVNTHRCLTAASQL